MWAGPLAPTSSTAAIPTLATRLGAPLLADINSRLRCNGHETPVLALYNLYLRRTVSRGSHRPTWCSTLAITLYPNPCGSATWPSDTGSSLCSPFPCGRMPFESVFMYPTLKVWEQSGAFV